MPVGSIAAGRRRGVASAAPTSTQWRIYFPSGDTGAGYFNIGEVEMASTPGGADQCNGGTASASSSSGSAVPSNSFDNAGGNAWTPATSAGSWLQYTFPSAVSVVELRVYSTGTNTAPIDLILQYWNGSSWVNGYVSNYASWAGGETKTFTITAPTFTVNPAITNNAGFTPGAVGDTYTLTYTASAGVVITAIQWKLNGSAIGGATGTTYTATTAGTLTCTVDISNAAGSASYTASIGTVAASPTYATQTVTMSDGSTVTLSDASNLEMYNRTA